MFVSLSNIRQALTILPASLCEFSIGVGYGWTAPTLKRFTNSNEEFFLDTEECSWMAAIPDLGRIIGSISVFLTVDNVGRKKLYHISTFFYVISWLMILFTRSVWIIYLARSIFGIMVGINDTTSPIYLAEISSPQLRGIFGSLSISFYFLGILMGFAFASYLSYSAAALVIVIIQMGVLLSTALLKEPPQFLLMKGRHNEAEDRFYWLQASKSDETKRHYDDMVKNMQQAEGTLSFREVFSKKANYKSIVIVSILGLIITFTGAGSLNSFITIAFSHSATVSAENLTMLFGVIQLTSTWLSSFIIERFNRRTMLFTGLLVSTATHLATAISYFWQENVTQIPYFTWLIFTTISIYAVVGAACLYPVFFVTHGELFSQNIKGLGSCSSVITYSVASFITSYVFLKVTEAYGICFNFFFFSLISLITIVYVYWFLPEARGKSLAEIQEILEK